MREKRKRGREDKVAEPRKKKGEGGGRENREALRRGKGNGSWR